MCDNLSHLKNVSAIQLWVFRHRLKICNNSKAIFDVIVTLRQEKESFKKSEGHFMNDHIANN